MRFSDLRSIKKDKGVAGLTILLSLIVMLFVIGLLVMIFSLMGGGLRDATYTSATGSITNETTATVVNSTGAELTTTTDSNYRNCALTPTFVTNATDGVLIASGNYTITGCTIYATSTVTTTFNNTLWNVTGTFTYDAGNNATSVIDNTTSSIAGSISWFTIFIVIGAMVVLILLTVIIITAIRGSGLMSGGSTPIGRQNIGSA